MLAATSAGRSERGNLVRVKTDGYLGRPQISVGASGNTYSDHGMHWDNSGKNGHYAPIRWSNL
jgi:hypothetical protein